MKRRNARAHLLVGIGFVSLLVVFVPRPGGDAAFLGSTGVAGASAEAAPDPLFEYLLAAAVDTATQPVETLVRAASLLRSGQGRAARALFERAAGELPGFADWALMFAAEAAATSGDTAAVRTLLAATEPALARDLGWRAIASARRAAGDHDGAILAAAVAGLTAADASVRAQAAYMAGRFALLDRDTSFAIRQFNIAIKTAPGSIRALDAARALLELPAARASDHRAIGLLYLRHGNVARGASSIDRYLDAVGSDASDRDELNLEVANAEFRASRYTDVERRVLPLANSRDTVTASEATLLLGRSRYRLGRTSEGRATLERTVEQFSGTRAASEAAFLLGDLDHDALRLESARRWYAAAALAYPPSPQAAEGAVRHAILALADGDADEVADVIDPVRRAQEWTSNGARLAFHSARARAAAGDEEGARLLLADVHRLGPISYYAARANGIAPDRALLDALPASPLVDDSARIHATGALKRIALLREIELDSAADYEIERLKRHLAADQSALYALAEAFHQAGDPYAGARMGRDILRLEGAWNERLLRIVYPFPYAIEILTEAERRGLDPFLVAGLIRQESLFQPAVRSSAGAIGLMQLMPATARGVATSERVPRPSVAQLRDPVLNIRLGTRYLADMLERYNGRLDFALAAYNAGPSRVTIWRRMFEADDPDLFAERIPFAQTRDYVRIVQLNAWIYSLLYGD